MPGLKSLSELRGSGTRSGLGRAARVGSGGYAMRRDQGVKKVLREAGKSGSAQRHKRMALGAGLTTGMTGVLAPVMIHREKYPKERQLRVRTHAPVPP